MLMFEQLIFRQAELVKCLNNTNNNWFSDGRRGHITTCINLVEANWKEFRSNHTAILAFRNDDNKNEKYFRNQDYVKTENTYLQIMTELRDALNDLPYKQELVRSLNGTSKWLMDKGEGNLTRGEIIVRMNSIETNWKEFKENHKELVLLRDASNRWEPYFSLDCYVNQEAKYLKIMSFIVDALDKLPKVSTEENNYQAKMTLPTKYPVHWPATYSSTYTSRLSK